MLKINLVNMPFAALNLPSIGLTQLKAALEERFGEKVSTNVIYLNHDFVDFMGGVSTYEHALSVDGLTSGIGDWIFRSIAFPSLEDNASEYFTRYYNKGDNVSKATRALILEKRAALDKFVDSLIEKYKLSEADVTGFTSLFAQSVASCAMALRLKSLNPKMITAMGGANCEPNVAMELCRHAPQLDFVFAGPSLLSFPEFAAKLLDGDMEGLYGIPGVYSRRNLERFKSAQRNDNSASYLSATGAERSIDDVLDLDYRGFLDSVESKLAGKGVSPSLLFETSRGCWWGEKVKCLFCGLNGSSIGYRAMKPENAIKQFNALFKYSGRCLRFDGVDNIAPESYYKDVFPHISPPEGTVIFYETKSDISEEHLHIMSKAGVKITQPGIEALATSSLKLMKKGAASFTNVAYLMNALLHGIHPVWNLLVGFPGESEDVYKKYHEDIPKLTHLPPPTGVFPIRFDRFSGYFERCDEYGLDLRPYDFYGMAYPFDADAARNFAYYFVDYNAGARFEKGLGKWHAAMTKGVNDWICAWKADNCGNPPQLYFEKLSSGELVVRDTRGGNSEEIQLDETQLRALSLLAKPMGRKDLATGLGGTVNDAENILAFLDGRRLVFRDDEKYMSIVLKEKLDGFGYTKRVMASRNDLDPATSKAPPALSRTQRVARKL